MKDMGKESDREERNRLFQGPAVELPAMLDAREQRVLRQQKFMKRYGTPLISFSMNIAGPVKNNALIRCGFETGVRTLRAALSEAGMPILGEELSDTATGCEACFALNAEPLEIKRITCEIEDRNSLGRLFDMDVIVPDPDRPAWLGEKKVERQEIGLPKRTCLICGRPAKECSSRRLHSVAELQEKTAAILWENYRNNDAEK